MSTFLKDEFYKSKNSLFTIQVTKRRHSRLMFQGVVVVSIDSKFPIGYEGIEWWKTDYEKVTDSEAIANLEAIVAKPIFEKDKLYKSVITELIIQANGDMSADRTSFDGKVVRADKDHILGELVSCLRVDLFESVPEYIVLKNNTLIDTRKKTPAKPVKAKQSEPYYCSIPKPNPELGKIQIVTMMVTTEFLTQVSLDKMDFIEFLKSPEFEKKFKEAFAVVKSFR